MVWTPLFLTNSFQLKRQGNFLVLPLTHFAIGMLRVKSQLSALHPTFVSTINTTFCQLLGAVSLLYKSGRSLTVECPPSSRKMILKGKKISLYQITRPLNWFQMLGLVLTGKGKVFFPFWTEHSPEISQNIHQ